MGRTGQFDKERILLSIVRFSLNDKTENEKYTRLQRTCREMKEVKESGKNRHY